MLVPVGRIGIHCFTTCQSSVNCTGVNLCQTKKELFCEILIDQEMVDNVCDNVNTLKNGCTYYTLVKVCKISRLKFSSHDF